MRKPIIVAAICSTALATPAIARDGQTYVELGFGPLIAEDIDVREISPNTGTPATLEPDDFGYDGAIIVGHDFGQFRTEVEAAYRNTDFDALQAGGAPSTVA